MLAKANRERLAVLLEEARSGAGGNERYAASLRYVPANVPVACAGHTQVPCAKLWRMPRMREPGDDLPRGAQYLNQVDISYCMLRCASSSAYIC